MCFTWILTHRLCWKIGCLPSLNRVSKLHLLAMFVPEDNYFCQFIYPFLRWEFLEGGVNDKSSLHFLKSLFQGESSFLTPINTTKGISSLPLSKCPAKIWKALPFLGQVWLKCIVLPHLPTTQFLFNSDTVLSKQSVFRAKLFPAQCGKFLKPETYAAKVNWPICLSLLYKKWHLCPCMEGCRGVCRCSLAFSQMDSQASS